MKAMYAGSFDPFTNGHLEIVKQAAEVFEQVLITIASNPAKARAYDEVQMFEAIRKTLEAEKLANVTVLRTHGLVADLAKNTGCSYLIRGLRNTTDYLYEENVAKINDELDQNLRTIYFRSDHEITSSSFVKELFKHRPADVRKYVSEPVFSLMTSEG